MQKTFFSKFTGVSGLCAHSARVKKGDLFYFLGESLQAAPFISEALRAGAVGFVLGRGPELDFGGKPHIRVDDVRLCFLTDCLEFYRELFSGFHLTGVTGTKGKSTITWLIYSLLQKMGVSTALVGTNGIRYEGFFQNSLNTTPGLDEFIRLLQCFKAAGVQEVVCEVSSQGLLQQRVPISFFKTRVFTDLSPEHLDAHGNMQNYFQAKSVFFAPESILADLINKNDYTGWRLDRSEWGKKLAGISGRDFLSFGLGEGENFLSVVDRKDSIDGCKMLIEYKKQQYECFSPLVGFFNAENLLCALSILVERGFALEKLLHAVPSLVPAEGRMELVSVYNGGRIYVDYAHSSQSFEFVLSVLRGLVEGRLMVVFGCGGDRDPGKRPLMGASASRYADVIIVTDDNPRTEDPDSIVAAITGGFAKEQVYAVERNRRKAIELGISELKKGDLLLVCGKGHEDYQIYGSSKTHFSDREEILRIVNERSS